MLMVTASPKASKSITRILNSKPFTPYPLKALIVTELPQGKLTQDDPFQYCITYQEL